MKYNDSDGYKILKLDYEAIHYIVDRENWSDTFKEKCKKVFSDLLDNRIHANHHAISRIIQRKLSIKNIIEIDKMDFIYTDGDAMIKFYDGIALLYKENRFHSAYKIGTLKERWAKYDK